MKPVELKRVRMTRAINHLIENIRLQKLPADKIVIFGSVARNEMTEYSDLDICILNEGELSERQMNEIERYFHDTLQEEMPVNFIYCNREKLAAGTHVYKSIRNEGLVLYE
jgi:predicted nucleotidyltransferase